MVATFTTKQFNHTAKKFLGQEVDLNAMTVMLLDATATFTATDTTLTQVAGASNVKEVDGNGWTTGGELFTGVAVTTTTTDDATFAGDDIRVRATGGIIGPVYAAVIYDDTDSNDAPLFYVEFSESIYAGEGTDFYVPGTIMSLLYSAP